MTLEELDRDARRPRRAAFVAAQAAPGSWARAAGSSRIGSCIADRVPYAGLTLYAMTKAALTGLTKGLARDLGPRGITANLVQPGSTDTDMNPADGAGADAERELIALGRFARARRRSPPTVAHLAGDGGRVITGAAITVDGGVTLSEEHASCASLLVIGAGLLEIVWAIALKHADGFTRLWPSVLGLGAAVGASRCCRLALKGPAVGTAYAVWVGIGAAGVAIAGMILLGEATSPARLLCLGLILIGIVGLRYVGEAG